MKKFRRKLIDNTRCAMHSGNVRTKLGLTCLRTCTSRARKTSSSSKRWSARPTGSRTTRGSRWRQQLRSRMQSTRREQRRRHWLARRTSWTSWSKWTRKTEFRDSTCRRRCTKRERHALPNSNTRGKLQPTKLKMLQSNCRENNRRDDHESNQKRRTVV